MNRYLIKNIISINKDINKAIVYLYIINNYKANNYLITLLHLCIFIYLSA